MQRQKKNSYSGGRYPDIGRYVRLYARKAGVSLVVGVAATGCIWPWHVSGDVAWVETGWVDTGAIPGDIGETGELWTVALPEVDTRNLTFEDPIWGWIDYRVELVIQDRIVMNWIVNNPQAALNAIDAALLTHPITDFREYTEDGAIEQQIKQVLMDAMTGTEGSDTHGIREATLVIEHYTDENEVDGDIG